MLDVQKLWTKQNKSQTTMPPEALLSFGAPLRAGYSLWIQKIIYLQFMSKV